MSSRPTLPPLTPPLNGLSGSPPSSSHPILVSPGPHLHPPAACLPPSPGYVRGLRTHRGSFVVKPNPYGADWANAAVPHSLRLGSAGSLGRKPLHASILGVGGQTLAPGPQAAEWVARDQSSLRGTMARDQLAPKIEQSHSTKPGSQQPQRAKLQARGRAAQCQAPRQRGCSSHKCTPYSPSHTHTTHVLTLLHTYRHVHEHTPCIAQAWRAVMLLTCKGFEQKVPLHSGQLPPC